MKFPNRLFIGEVFEDDVQRQFIISNVEKLNENRKIGKTKLLNAFPSMKLLNPHAHIDGIPNYVIIMTVTNSND
jgi:hypothetical protein